MYWANFLHFYQPADQQPDILESIVAQCYRPIFQGFARHPHLRLTINVNGSLLELFDRHGYHDLIDLLRKAAQDGRIEFTGSAKYHALLPFLPRSEMERQITINNETNAYFLGTAYRPKGFFPPEMAYNPTVATVVNEMGFSWIVLDEIALGGATGKVDPTKTYTIAGTNLNAYFRERRLSNLVMGAYVRTKSGLLTSLRDDVGKHQYVVTAMDGETFGHHRPGLEELLFALFTEKRFRTVRISDLSALFPNTTSIRPLTSTWASSEQDIKQKVQFFSWADPKNPIHALQWRLFRLVLQKVSQMRSDHPQYAEVRKKMDIALASDHFWWASGKPWWSLEMIELGAYRLLDTVSSIPRLPRTTLQRAERYFQKIIETGFAWQRTGYIRRLAQEQKGLLRIPFKERVVGKGRAGKAEYQAFVSIMKRLEKQSAARGEYEQAILWREAVYNLEHKLDVYEAVNAVNLIRTKIPNEKIMQIVERYKAQYSHLRGGQPEQRGT